MTGISHRASQTPETCNARATVGRACSGKFLAEQAIDDGRILLCRLPWPALT